MPGKIVVVGSINTDFVVRLNMFPAPGETVVGKSFRTFGGGKGANQATSASRLGASVAMIAAVGDDPYSSQRIADIEAAGVDCSSILHRNDAQGGIAIIQVDETGQNTIVMVPGANGSVCPADVNYLLPPLLSSSDIVLGPLELRLETMLAAARIANDAGARLIINTAPVVEGTRDLVALLDTLIVNEIEAGQILDRAAPVKSGEVSEVAEQLAALGPQNILMTLGAHGAYIRTSDKATHIPAPRVDVVDTTGAGDATVGAYAAAISEGSDPVDAAERAVLAGSYAVQIEGAQSSQATRTELDLFIQSFGDF